MCNVLKSLPHIKRYNDQYAAMKFKGELGCLLNRFNWDTLTNTPDWILAGYLLNILKAEKKKAKAVKEWGER